MARELLKAPFSGEIEGQPKGKLALGLLCSSTCPVVEGACSQIFEPENGRFEG